MIPFSKCISVYSVENSGQGKIKEVWKQARPFHLKNRNYRSVIQSSSSRSKALTYILKIEPHGFSDILSRLWRREKSQGYFLGVLSQELAMLNYHF